MRAKHAEKMNAYIERSILRQMQEKKEKCLENEQIEIEAALELESISDRSKNDDEEGEEEYDEEDGIEIDSRISYSHSFVQVSDGEELEDSRSDEEGDEPHDPEESKQEDSQIILIPQAEMSTGFSGVVSQQSLYLGSLMAIPRSFSCSSCSLYLKQPKMTGSFILSGTFIIEGLDGGVYSTAVLVFQVYST